MCWILSSQKGGKLLVTVRDLQYFLKAAAYSPTTIHNAIVRLEQEQFITTERVTTGTLVTVLRPSLYAIMPLEEKETLCRPHGRLKAYCGDCNSVVHLLYADVQTVLNYYRKTCRRGDRRQESEPVIRHWLEQAVSKERLYAAVDAYETECVALGRTYRKLASTFFDPQNGEVESFLPDEVEVDTAPRIRESTKKMREVFARREGSKVS